MITDKTAHRKLARRYALRKSIIAYLFLFPAVLFFALFLAWPVASLFMQTFQTGGEVMSPAKFVGIDNWRRAFCRSVDSNDHSKHHRILNDGDSSRVCNRDGAGTGFERWFGAVRIFQDDNLLCLRSNPC